MRREEIEREWPVIKSVPCIGDFDEKATLEQLEINSSTGLRWFALARQGLKLNVLKPSSRPLWKISFLGSLITERHIEQGTIKNLYTNKVMTPY